MAPSAEVSSSPANAAMSDFKEGMKHLRDRQPTRALSHVRRALRSAPNNPFYLSYAGLLVALAEHRFADAESLCLEALSIRHNHPQLYLNLAEVYEKARRPTEAIEVLEKGLLSAGRDLRIRRALKKFGRRREPVLPFLHRSHSLNRLLGKWRHRLMKPQQAA